MLIEFYKDINKINVRGVFISIGWQPSTNFIMPAKLNEQGEIIIDKNCKTSTSGLFAAGDVTDIIGKQMIIACGDGAKAALSVANYLGGLNK